MHCVRVDRPSDWTNANIYPICDLHLGDPASDYKLICQRIEQIKNDPHGLGILNGDILNTALRNSVSDVYGETRTPMQQITDACTLLDPIKEKIIGADIGNHEYRAYREDGIDMMRLICRELRIEDCYCPEGVLIFLRFGTANMHGRHKDSAKQRYCIYATHGSGGGRKEGAKAIRLADMAAIVDADVYIHGHTHLPMIMKQAFFRTSTATSSVQIVEKIFVNAGATVDYGGYGQAGEFKPNSKSTPVVHLDARERNMTATL